MLDLHCGLTLLVTRCMTFRQNDVVEGMVVWAAFAALVLGPLVIGHVLNRRNHSAVARAARGLCPHCGYDRVGLAGGCVCPGCGRSPVIAGP